MAKYRFHQISYIGDKLIPAGGIAEVPDGMMPGPHMEPVDDAAVLAATQNKVVFTGEVPDVMLQLLPMYEEATARAQAAGQSPIDNAALTASFKAALADLLDPQASQKARADEIEAAVKAAIDNGKADRQKAFDAAVAAAVKKELQDQLGGGSEPAATETTTVVKKK